MHNLMNKTMRFMTESFAPKVNKVVNNPWVSAIQDAIMAALPLVFVGSLITMFALLKTIISSIPDLLMEKKGFGSQKIISGASSLVLFMMLLFPTITADGKATFILSRFGATGMFLSMITGLFVGLVMSIAAKYSFFDEDTPIPDFVVGWFNNLLPITFILFCGWLITFQFRLDFFDIVLVLFTPLASILQTYPGFVLSVFIPVFLYTFGISSWVMMPVIDPVYMSALAANAAAVASGSQAVNIATTETCYSVAAIGGLGATLSLSVMMLILSKSAQLKAVGKAVMIPSLFNINEPLVFGAPIAFNPYLMVPMWLNGLLIPTIVYGVMKIGLVTIPSSTFLLWYRSEEHTSELQSPLNLVCRLLLEKKK